MLNADRRHFLGLAGGAGLALATGGVAAAQTEALAKMTGGVVPISAAERLARVEQVQAMMDGRGL
jgi:hypothetical protein